MSKKKLQVEGIMNELEGASLFFVKTSSQTDPKIEPESTMTEPVIKELETKTELTKEEPTKTNNHETPNESMHAFNRDNMMVVNTSDISNHDDIETIRKSVKQVGKEEFYLRLTLAEKSEIAKIVYTFNALFSGEGRKISANDVGRIAIHQLLIDYHENGEQSLLAQVLAALNA